MSRFYVVTVVAVLLFSGLAGYCNAADGTGVAVKVGTLGGSIEVSQPLTDYFRFRGGVNYLTYSFDSTISDVNYEFDAEFGSFSTMLDWQPFGGAFYFAGGAYFNNHKIDVTGSIDRSVVPANYSQYAYLADLVSIKGDVTFLPIAPYAGLGWRGNFGESDWGMALDLGVLFQGEPDVDNLRIDAPVDVNDVDVVKTFLAEEEQKIEDDLSEFQYYPVVSLMFFYNF